MDTKSGKMPSRLSLNCADLVGTNSFGTVRRLGNPELSCQPIHWAHCIAPFSSFDHLQCKDLVILYPCTVEQIDHLLALLPRFKERNLSGTMLIFRGSAPSPEELRSIADAADPLGLPILCSDDISNVSKYVKDLCQRILMNSRFQSENDRIIRELLVQMPLDTYSICNSMAALGYDGCISYVCAFIRVTPKPGGKGEDDTVTNVLDMIYDAVSGKIKGFTCGSIIEDHIVFILPELVDRSPVRKVLVPLFSELSEQFPDLVFRVGIGPKLASFEQFRDSAAIASKLSRLPHRNTVLDFEEQIVFRMLCQFNNDLEAYNIYMHVLGPLIDYDRKNGTDLVSCLKVYLENNHNLQACASELYLHINTMRKRIAKIEELLNCDLRNDSWHSFRYYFAFFVEDYLQANTNLLNDYPSHAYLTKQSSQLPPES